MAAPASLLPPSSVHAERGRRSAVLRSFFTAAWLGWQIESNWTDPFLFAVYSLAKPLASAGILVVMYSVITAGDFQAPVFAYIYFGNAFYIYVGAVMVGISWAVIDDREHYKTLKYMYVAPIRIPAYWIGRGVARFLTGSIAVALTIAFGAFFLHVPLNLPHVDWPLFAASLLLGIAVLCMLGLILASVTLLVAHHFFLIGEAVAGALFLLSGAIFPLDILPAWLQPIGLALPITYWLELMRRSLAGGVAGAFPTFTAYTDMQLLGVLLGLSLLYGCISYGSYRLCDRLARERGLIDLVTNY
jgi:ABC-2 type transport system permease protein